MSAWTDHVARWKDCRLCPLCDQRTNIVLARGQVPCDVLLIGEAPGQSEDAVGRPFVERAPAGSLLEDILKAALEPWQMPGTEGWAYNAIRLAWTNLVCCFPRNAKMSGDHQPELSEIKACQPRLEEFIKLAAPRLIVLVGRLASDYVRHDAYGRIMGAKAVDILHPSHILSRMPQAQKRGAVDKCIVTIRHAVAEMMEPEGEQ